MKYLDSVTSPMGVKIIAGKEYYVESKSRDSERFSSGIIQIESIKENDSGIIEVFVSPLTAMFDSDRFTLGSPYAHWVQEIVEERNYDTIELSFDELIGIG